MKTLLDVPIKVKLTVAFVILSLVPTLILAGFAIKSAQATAIESQGTLESEAVTIMSRVERNMYERYGDAQAFGLNTLLYDKSNWYDKDSDSPLAILTNRDVASYSPIYYMGMMVDLKGRVVSVSSKDDTGKPIDTHRFFGKDYSDATWFTNCLEGKFLKGDSLDGTYVEDIQQDNDIKEIFGGSGLYIGFSAPVKNTQGKVIGVWRNFCKMKVLQDIVTEAYQELAKTGYKTGQVGLPPEK